LENILRDTRDGGVDASSHYRWTRDPSRLAWSTGWWPLSTVDNQQMNRLCSTNTVQTINVIVIIIVITITIISCAMSEYPDEKVDHKEDVERKVDLLGSTVRPFLTRLHRLAVTDTHTDTHTR